jgi:hypothetical protein
VIVWARRERKGDVAVALSDAFPEHDVLHLSVSPRGAGLV